MRLSSCDFVANKVRVPGTSWLMHLCYRIDDINKNCLEQFRAHWNCLEDRNQQLWHCRTEEWKLNGCVFDKLVSHKLVFAFEGNLLRSI